MILRFNFISTKGLRFKIHIYYAFIHEALVGGASRQPLGPWALRREGVRAPPLTPSHRACATAQPVLKY